MSCTDLLDYELQAMLVKNILQLYMEFNDRKKPNISLHLPFMKIWSFLIS